MHSEHKTLPTMGDKTSNKKRPRETPDEDNKDPVLTVAVIPYGKRKRKTYADDRPYK